MAVDTFSVKISVANVSSDIFQCTVYVAGSRTMTVRNAWTINDETALLVGTSRRRGEHLDTFLARTRTKASNAIGPTRDGIIAGIASETGIKPTWWIEVNCNHRGAVFTVADGHVMLESSAGVASLNFLTMDDNSGDITCRTLQDLTDMITATDGWTYTVQDANVELSDPLYLLLEQSSSMPMSIVANNGRVIRVGNHSIVPSSIVVLTNTDVMRREVPIQMRFSMSHGDYCVDYDGGVIYTFDDIKTPLHLIYTARAMPFLVSYFEFSISHLESGIFSQMVHADGTPSTAAEKIIYQSLTKGNRTFWSSK